MKLLVHSVLTMALIACADARPWSEDVMYFVMTDRFHDADRANNVPEGSDPSLHDPEQKDINRYLGGDLRGLEKALQAGYFNDLGVTALWLTPVVRNVWRSGYDLGGWKTGYHGYWTQDWLDIDPHLTSAVSLVGEVYPSGPEGRMAHYRDFVRLAHSKGIKVIQDVVMNHAGPVFYYDVNGNGVFDTSGKEEWVQPFKRDGFHDNARWADLPRWNVRRTQPDGPRELLGAEIRTRGVLSRIEAYGRKGFSDHSLGSTDGEEIMCDFFSLRDLWTAGDGRYFDELVDEFVEIYHFYLTTVGVDGLRVDTVKHAHHEFWDAFTERLRKRLGPAAAEKLIFGEIYDGNPAVLGRYTWRSDWPQRHEPGLDGVLDFHVCFAAREYLRHGGGGHGSPHLLEKALASRTSPDENGRPHYNPNPGPDGLNARDKMITFIENHDGLNRFRVGGVSEIRNRLAQALVMTLPGIPCLYYGTEFALADPVGRVGEDGESGRMMFFRKEGGPSIRDVMDSTSFREIRMLADLRARMPVLRTGEWLPLWVDSPESVMDDGVFAFARAAVDGGQFVVVAMNVSDQDRVTGIEGHAMRLPSRLDPANRQLKPALTIGDKAVPADSRFPAVGDLHLPVPASSLVVYELASPATEAIEP